MSIRISADIGFVWEKMDVCLRLIIITKMDLAFLLAPLLIFLEILSETQGVEENAFPPALMASTCSIMAHVWRPAPTIISCEKMAFA